MKMRRACPECRSSNIRLRSRAVYIKRIGICIVIFLFGLWFYNGMLEEKDVDGVVIGGIAAGFVMMLTAFLMGIIWLVSAMRTKEIDYKCLYCKSIFVTPATKPLIPFGEKKFPRQIKKD